ncbi:hypothetical protein BJ912DRAFT_948336 [Pholiota molesta]|nr:hypothetical protein BJ912DRAFT_948336 [Pholiota molesta]
MSTTLRLRSLLRFTIILSCCSTSFHEAIHPPATPDTDDGPTSTTGLLQPLRVRKPQRRQHQLPIPTAINPPPVGRPRRSLVRRVLPRLDPDDPGFVDPTVSMALNFTGSAAIGFDKPKLSRGQLVFSQSGLADGPHQLVVQVGQNSTFIFERLIYTMEEQASPSTNPIQQSSPSPSMDPQVKKHNVATFGGAVGGSVGVLALFSLGLALSIMRRRYLAAKREQRDHESLHTNASDDSPHMVGPAPFVPRYFPDTVIPSEPPTYMASLASNNNNSTLLATLPLAALAPHSDHMRTFLPHAISSVDAADARPRSRASTRSVADPRVTNLRDDIS